jgi:aspartate dehydrogenase
MARHVRQAQTMPVNEGPVRQLCPLAPSNVNTMAAAAVAEHNLRLDGTRTRLASDPRCVQLLPDIRVKH